MDGQHVSRSLMEVLAERLPEQAEDRCLPASAKTIVKHTAQVLEEQADRLLALTVGTVTHPEASKHRKERFEIEQGDDGSFNAGISIGEREYRVWAPTWEALLDHIRQLRLLREC